VPQVPQLAESLSSLAHVSPHCARPGLHVPVQTPAWHTRPAPQLLPQTPQFLASLASSTHRPLQAVPVVQSNVPPVPPVPFEPPLPLAPTFGQSPARVSHSSVRAQLGAENAASINRLQVNHAVANLQAEFLGWRRSDEFGAGWRSMRGGLIDEERRCVASVHAAGEIRWAATLFSTSCGVPSLDYTGTIQGFRVSLARSGGSVPGRVFVMTRYFRGELSQTGEIKTRNQARRWPKGGHTSMRPIPNFSGVPVRRGTAPASAFEMPTLPLGIAVPRQLHLALEAEDEPTLALPAIHQDPELDIPTRELPAIADYPQFVALGKRQRRPRLSARRSIIRGVFLFVLCALIGSSLGMGIGVLVVRGTLF